MEEQPTTDEEIQEAIEALLHGTADFDTVMCLAGASFEREQDIAPSVVVNAINAKYETDRDYANGGADQFVWNQGPEMARSVGRCWREIGAVENGDLLLRLADGYDTFRKELGEQADGLTVKHFLAYRKQVKGPYFDVPDVGDELAEALVEWAIEHAAEFRLPQST